MESDRYAKTNFKVCFVNVNFIFRYRIIYSGNALAYVISSWNINGENKKNDIKHSNNSNAKNCEIRKDVKMPQEKLKMNDGTQQM